MRKREYERHSGTGRGKEVAKGGAGRRETWGDNPKNIARNYERNNDDYIINSALNPEAQKERKERYEKKEKEKRHQRKRKKKENLRIRNIKKEKELLSLRKSLKRRS